MKLWGKKSSNRPTKKRSSRSSRSDQRTLSPFTSGSRGLSSRSHRSSTDRTPMDKVWTGSLRTDGVEAPQSETKGSRRSRRAESSGGFTLLHGAVLLFGIVLGAAIYGAGSSFFRGLERSATGASAGPEAQATTPRVPRPTPPRISSPSLATGSFVPPAGLTPVQVVEQMHQASLAGKTQVAYAYWQLQPTEVAFIGSGVEMSLSQCIDLAHQHAEQVRSAEFRLEEQSDDRARVGQYLGGQKRLVYSLLKNQGRWQITISSPN